MRVFAKGGYTVVREFHAGLPTLLVVDHGPLGYLSIAAHGHDDALAIWLHVGGQPVLVDAGTYLYHAERVQRDFFRSSAAHNTITVENESGNISRGPFQWLRKGDAKLISHRMCSDWYVEGEYEGYKSRFNVVHRRRIERIPSGFDVIDWLQGPGAPRPVSIRFLLAPDLTASHGGNDWIVPLPNHVTVTITGPSGFEMTKQRARLADPAGWISTYFGDRRPTEQLMFDGVLGEGAVVTKIVIGERPRS